MKSLQVGTEAFGDSCCRFSQPITSKH